MPKLCLRKKLKRIFLKNKKSCKNNKTFYFYLFNIFKSKICIPEFQMVHYLHLYQQIQDNIS